MAVCNLILDMGNVLLAWEPRALALRAAGNGQDAEILYSALFGSAGWPLHDAGQIDEEELLRASLSRTPERLHPALKALHEQWPGWMAPVPGADAFTLRALGAGLRLYLLSNAGTRFPQALEGRAFYPQLHGAMVSAHERLLKPDLRIYERLCERFGLLPRECLFVDDMRENVDGAIASGMEALLFNGDYDKVEYRLRGLGIILPRQTDNCSGM